MRYLRQTIPVLSWPSLRDARGRLTGLPFAVTAFVPALFVGWQGCVAGLLVASIASFLVYVPMTALALNGGEPLSEAAPAPSLTSPAYAVLLGLWTASAWLAAALLPLLR